MPACPKCGYSEVWCGDTPARHWVRIFLASPKRYCLICGNKWRVKYSIYHLFNPQALVPTVLISAAAIWLFFLLSDKIEKNRLEEFNKKITEHSSAQYQQS